ncbi:kinase-like domain-containing protein [Cercophora newfieldiana]|uniref:non-specific serine/threonine protein kinase n=1 Tax=Cercophora newfieldiana TaxID=92897 RepID=A0AA39XT38_9PEZI|nr:kinase-like domain-containing protein [Cercophora newfieldiana]
MPNNLQHLEIELSAPKQKAIEDARKGQAAIVRECIDAGTEPPPYLLTELIGKGSFGRVYRASDTRAKPARAVAVKIISIEEGDTFSPGSADTFNDILKEVNTLKLLGSSGAKNINIVVDSLLVGQSVWIVTEYCAGGSVASLMRPTGGLPEKWIIPILREVAEAVYWVHRQGIIHRDIKCANVLVTDAGGIQLCDFGVAGIMETKFDKRSTVTGTLQWMAPELFDTAVSYGIEVDIWAFGSMAYEVATGLPPNATTNIDIPQFGSYLKQYCPRLKGDTFSDALKSLVAFCLVDDPKKRPRIEEVQEHMYIANTEEEYPTASLSKLVSAYKLWEAQGGSRRSLFSAGGAQGFAKDDEEDQNQNDEWAFDDGDDGDDSELVMENPDDAQAVYDAYGLNLGVPQVAEPSAKQMRRRRLPPKNIPQFKGPLEKVFDPNTISNYGENARAFYGRQASPPPPTSDLPLRDNSENSTVRESLIDLDASLGGGGDTLTRFGSDAETIKPGNRASEASFSDAKRKTQDWTFPSMSAAVEKPQEWTFPSMSAVVENPDEESYQGGSYQASRIDAGSAPPTRIFHPTEGPLGGHHATSASVPELNRASTLSLIDLDASIVDVPNVVYPPPAEPYPTESYPLPEEPHALSVETTNFSRPNRASNLSLIDLDASIVDVTRPSTAGSYPFSTMNNSNRASNFSLIDLDASFVPHADITRPTTAGSINTNSPGSINDSTPFDLEFELPSATSTTSTYREPSMFVDGALASNLSHALSPSDRDTPPSPSSSPPPPSLHVSSSPAAPVYPQRTTSITTPHHSVSFSFSSPTATTLRTLAIVPPLPPLPSPPSANALQGQGSREELKQELQAMIASLNEHLQHTAECLSALPVRRAGGENARWSGSAGSGRSGSVNAGTGLGLGEGV